jgi:hypothetical protein
MSKSIKIPTWRVKEGWDDNYLFEFKDSYNYRDGAIIRKLYNRGTRFMYLVSLEAIERYGEDYIYHTEVEMPLELALTHPLQYVRELAEKRMEE